MGNPTQTNFLKIKMSNSDKFQQDDAIVAAEPEVQGVLAGDDVAEAGDESVANNKIGQDEFKNDEFDGVSKDNIIDGERSNRASGFAKAEQEAVQAARSIRALLPIYITKSYIPRVANMQPKKF